jgi:hypothetical protein
MPVTRLRVLLSEASSLTAREHLTVLGAAGVQVEAMSSDRFALCRWSRWARRLHHCPAPGTDPAGYLQAVSAVLAEGGFDALLPTHEQAWLFAVARDRLPPAAPVALAPAAAFGRVQSKAAFARLLDELGAPQPRWWPVEDDAALGRIPCPYFLKSAFSTAGQGVRQVRTPAERARALTELRASGQELIAQAPAPGQYGQVQALFDDGRLVAAHTSVQAGLGMGGSAAARLSVDHPSARFWAAAVGEKVAWHGGLTMDYLHQDGEPVFIECNPRTVEPGNAAAAGVNLPLLSIALATGRPLPDTAVTGRPGVRTRGTLALLLGSADQAGSRRAVLRTLSAAAARKGVFAHSAEVLTPVIRDPPSLIPLLRVATALLARPAGAAQISGRTIAAYSVTEQTITRLYP